MPKGSLTLGLVATIVGGGGLLEYGSKFSFRSASLGLGLGIFLLWLVEVAERRRRNRDPKIVHDGSEAAPL
jgi:hypothetical protein